MIIIFLAIIIVAIVLCLYTSKNKKHLSYKSNSVTNPSFGFFVSSSYRTNSNPNLFTLNPLTQAVNNPFQTLTYGHLINQPSPPGLFPSNASKACIGLSCFYSYLGSFYAPVTITSIKFTLVGISKNNNNTTYSLILIQDAKQIFKQQGANFYNNNLNLIINPYCAVVLLVNVANNATVLIDSIQIQFNSY